MEETETDRDSESERKRERERALGRGAWGAVWGASPHAGRAQVTKKRKIKSRLRKGTILNAYPPHYFLYIL